MIIRSKTSFALAIGGHPDSRKLVARATERAASTDSATLIEPVRRRVLP